MVAHSSSVPSGGRPRRQFVPQKSTDPSTRGPRFRRRWGTCHSLPFPILLEEALFVLLRSVLSLGVGEGRHRSSNRPHFPPRVL